MPIRLAVALYAFSVNFAGVLALLLLFDASADFGVGLDVVGHLIRLRVLLLQLILDCLDAATLLAEHQLLVFVPVQLDR